MPRGMLAALGWLLYVINIVLDISGLGAASAFLDDITIGGTVFD